MNPLEFTKNDLTHYIKRHFGKGDYHSRALYREVMKNGNAKFYEHPAFKKSPLLAKDLKNRLSIPLPKISDKVEEKFAVKFLCNYQDGLSAESVLIRMKHYNTLCISSQIGCKMGCAFCETGKMGFRRNLTVSEIVSQVYVARHVLKENIKNIVFMGMGEPFDNYDNVVKSISVLTDQHGLDIALRHMTLSTAGLVNEINTFKTLPLSGVNLALSLNAPNDQIRSQLMPINKRHSMADIREALHAYPLKNRGSFLIEYVLIKDVNDKKEHAEEVALFLDGLNVRFNLIPLNKTQGFNADATSDEDIHRFAAYLQECGIFVIKRWSRGSSLAAACGQLGGKSGDC